jgi:cell division septation protein DedD
MGVGKGPQGGADDDGGLPWLEPAPDPDRGSLSFKSLAIIGTIFLLVFIALMAVFYNRIAGTGPSGGTLVDGSPTLIAAPAGPFKITPDESVRSQLDYEDGSAAKESPPRFAGGSEKPLSGAEQIERAASGQGPAAVDLGSASNPQIGYVRKTTKPDTSNAAQTAPKVTKPTVSEPKPVPEPVKTAAAPKEPAKLATPPQTAAAGGYMLQLGAFSSRDSALNGWKQFSGKYPGSLSGLSPDVQAFQNSSNKTLYRLRAAGLTSRARADARCAALKAAKQPCFVVAP